MQQPEPRFVQATRVHGPFDPPPTTRDIQLTQKFTSTITTDSKGIANVTVNSFMAIVPGGSTIWDRVRFMKFSVYAPAVQDSYISAQLDEPGSTSADNPNFVDYGTAGSRRPALHLSPSFIERIQWIPTSSAHNLLILQSLPDTKLILSITAQLRSTLPTASTF
jgi:hypothetical protein